MNWLAIMNLLKTEFQKKKKKKKKSQNLEEHDGITSFIHRSFGYLIGFWKGGGTLKHANFLGRPSKQKGDAFCQGSWPGFKIRKKILDHKSFGKRIEPWVHHIHENVPFLLHIFLEITTQILL